jgi:type IV secretory pathway VirB6-like protein
MLPQPQPTRATRMPGFLVNPGATPDLVAHVIQVALTPIFLLSGIATLMNVFSSRLARVADLIAKAAEHGDEIDPDELNEHLAHLRRRSLALDCAVVLAAIGGAATCISVLTLFVSALQDATVASVLFATFGLAVLCTLGAIGAFTAEMLMAGSGMRATVAAQRRYFELT